MSVTTRIYFKSKGKEFTLPRLEENIDRLGIQLVIGDKIERQSLPVEDRMLFDNIEFPPTSLTVNHRAIDIQNGVIRVIVEG